MYYALVFYPKTDQASINEIRHKYDPMVDLIEPHVTVLFPVSEQIGEDNLITHIESVVKNHAPFEVHLGGFHKSADHWLFLTLQRGNEEVRALHRSLYTGPLANLRRDDIEFVPHVSLGFFLKEGARHVWDRPRESDFDAEKYEVAPREAETLALCGKSVVEDLHLVKIPDEVIEWMRGERSSFPHDSRVVAVRRFHLGSGSAQRSG
jgi:2'-5' RNA ligase